MGRTGRLHVIELCDVNAGTAQTWRKERVFKREEEHQNARARQRLEIAMGTWRWWLCEISGLSAQDAGTVPWLKKQQNLDQERKPEWGGH